MKSRYLLTIVIMLVFFHRTSGQTGCISGDCVNGVGTYVWDTGDEYTGQWASGARTGLGCYDWYNGAFYYGFFLDGKLEGRGFYLATDTTEDLIGYFKSSVLTEKADFETTGCILGNCIDGIGVYLWESNDLYLGQWIGGARTGYGRYDWENGSSYVGHFYNGKLDGEGEYIGDDKTVMKGKFVNSEFQGEVITGGSTAAETTVREGDFCTIIQTVINDYPAEFENLKGTKEEEDEYSIGDYWDSNIKVSGSLEAKVASGTPPDYNTWYSVLYKATTWDDAYFRYKEYVEKIKNCSTSCCSMVSDESKYDQDNYKSFVTSWLTYMVKDGYDSSYEELLIEIEVSSEIIGDGYQIVARVKKVPRK